jgi:hypothetical protein
MTLEGTEEARWFESLAAETRAQFMALLVHGLTIAQRVLCSCDGNVEGTNTVESVRQLNEAHHQIAWLLVEQLQGLHRRQVVLYLFGITDALAYDQAMQAWSYAKINLAH